MSNYSPARAGSFENYDFDLLTVFNLSQKAGRVGAWVYSLETKALWWSDEVYELFGIDTSVQVSNELFFRAVHDDDRDTVAALFAGALEGKPYDINHRIIVNGEVCWVHERGQLYYDQHFQTDLVIGMVHDIDKDMNDKLEIQRRNDELTVIKDYFTQTAVCGNVQDIVRIAKENISKIVSHVAISMLVTGEDDRMNFFSTQNNSIKYFGVKPQNRPRYLGFEAMRTQHECFARIEEHADEHLRESLVALGAKSLTAFPIIYNGRAFAALTVASASQSPLPANEKLFCQTICGYLAFQLQNAALGEQVHKQSADRQMAEDDINTIFDESLDFISIVDEKGCFKRMNPVFAKRLGYGKKFLAATPVYDIAYPEDRERTLNAVKDTIQNGYVRGFRNRLLCSDGSTVHIEWNAKYIPRRGYIIVISRDITKQLEYEKTKLELAKSAEIEKLKLEFFANLSHEFKTPLNIILSSVQMVDLQCRPNVPQAVKYVNYIEQNSYRLLKLANNLIDTSKLDSNFMGILLQPGDIVDAVRTIVQSCEGYAENRQLTVLFRTSVTRRAICYDHGLLDRIMLNLLSNAIKHTAAGGSICVMLDETDEFVRIKVQDSGDGIPPEMLPVIFDRFRVVAKSFCRSGDGSGLGLSIVKALVEMHYGEVGVESTPDMGSTFFFTISKRISPVEKELADSGETGFSYDEDVRRNSVRMEMS